MNAPKHLIAFVLLLGLLEAPVWSAEPPARTAAEQRVLRGVIKLPHEREQAIMQALGIVPNDGFLSCLCRRAAYGSSSASQFWHPGTIGKYDERYSCNQPGDPCVVSGYGCMRYPKPTDPAIYEYCALQHPGADGESLLDEVLRGIRPAGDKHAADYRRELAACRERGRFERELDYLGGNRKAGHDYLGAKKVPVIAPPAHMRKRLNDEAERARVEQVNSVLKAQTALREQFEKALPQQMAALIEARLGKLETYQQFGSAALTLTTAAREDATLSRLQSERKLRDALMQPGVTRDQATWNAEVRQINQNLTAAHDREERLRGQAARLDKALKTLEAVQTAGKAGGTAQSLAQAMLERDSHAVVDALVSSGRLINDQFKGFVAEVGDLDELRKTLATKGLGEAEFEQLAPRLESAETLKPLTEGMDDMLKQYDRAQQIWGTMKEIEKGLAQIAHVETSGGYSEAQKNLLKGFTALSELTRKGAEFLPPGASDMMVFYAEAMKLPAVFDEKIRKIVDRHDVSAEIMGSQAGSNAMKQIGSGVSLDRDDYLFREAGLKAYVIWSENDRAYTGPKPYVLIPEADGVPYQLDEANYRKLAEMAYYYPMAYGRRLTDADVAEHLRLMGPNGRLNIDDVRRMAEKAQTEAAEDARIAEMFGQKTLRERDTSLTQIRDDLLEKSDLAQAAEGLGMDVHAFGDKRVWLEFKDIMRKRLPSNCELAASTQKALFNRWRVREQRAEVEQFLSEYGVALKTVESWPEGGK